MMNIEVFGKRMANAQNDNDQSEPKLHYSMFDVRYSIFKEIMNTK